MPLPPLYYSYKQYAPHGSLRQRHARETPLPLATVVHYVKIIADTLQYAHDDRLIHRDVKPDNVLLDASDDLQLTILASLFPRSLCWLISTRQCRNRWGNALLHGPRTMPGQTRGSQRSICAGNYGLRMALWFASLYREHRVQPLLPAYQHSCPVSMRTASRFFCERGSRDHARAGKTPG